MALGLWDQFEAPTPGAVHYVAETDVLEIEFAGIRRSKSYVYRDLLAFHMGRLSGSPFYQLQGITIVGFRWLLDRLRALDGTAPSEGGADMAAEGKKVHDAFTRPTHAMEIRVIGDTFFFIEEPFARRRIARHELTKHFDLLHTTDGTYCGVAVKGFSPKDSETALWRALDEVLDLLLAPLLTPAAKDRPPNKESRAFVRLVVPILEHVAANAA